MKTRSPRFSAALLLSVFLLTGCGTGPDSSLLSPESAAERSTTSASSAQDKTDTPADTTADTTAQDTTALPDTASAADTTEPGTAGSTAPGTAATRITQGTRATRTSAAAGTSAAGSTEKPTETEASVTSSSAVTEAEPELPTGNLRDTVAAMTVEQKCAQMILCTCSDQGTAMAAVKAGVGGLCLFAKPFSGKTKQQVRDMNAAFQQNAKLPLLISVDEEGGTVNRVSLNPNLRAVPFWGPKALFAEGGWDLVTSDTKEKAELLLDLGVNVNLAPVCDVPLDASNYIYNRCFSLNADETAEYIRVVVSEMRADGLGSTLKHFPGYGGSVDTHKNMGYDDRDYSAFTDGDFKPFRAGIRAGADAVMVSHNIVSCMDSDYPASLSAAVHEILRDDLGFKGVVISDDLGMDAIKQFSGGKNPAVAAVLAGNDLICYSDYQSSIAAIVQAVNAGTIEESRIDESVLRILQWKRRLGLL